MGAGLHRALNLKQRLYRLISPNFRTALYVNGSIINNATLTEIINHKLRRCIVGLGCGLLAAGWLAVSAFADDKPASAAAEPPANVETRHNITLGGHSFDYRAIAETIGLTDPKGEPTASVFTVAYLAEAAAGERRPVAFVFNGGPGAASVFLHLGALGPRILDTPATGAVPNPPYNIVDNPSTWLAFTDLVFVDPVGTGFSRGKGKEDNPDKPFWNVQGDVNSLGAVVRRWLTRHQRWTSPVYLVGESYGGYRAAAMARSLPRDVGVTVSGLVLVSPALDMEILHPDISNTLAPGFRLPSFASTAAALGGHSATAEATGETERFALSDYPTGLAAVKGVPAPGDLFIARVARLIGLPDEVVRRARARVSGHLFARELRRGQGEVLSQYDATVTRPSGADPANDNAGDPVLDASVAAYTAAFVTYAAAALDYRTEQPYRVLPHEVSRQWSWDSGHEGGALGLPLSSLENTLLAYPETRLLVVNGRYDLVTPYLSSRWLVDQLSVPASVRAGIRLRVYEGGHMMYMRPASRAALAADAAELFASENGASRK
jgi:carboxypeptidase C (cathepsin A)